MTFPYAGLPAPFDSDHALRVVGRIAVESARLELYLAMMLGHVDEQEARPVTELVRVPNDRVARCIRRAVNAREWLPAPDSTPIQSAITEWADDAVAILDERGDLMHSPWFSTTVEGTGVVVAGHSSTGDHQPVDVTQLEDLSRRIEEACEQFPTLYVYVFAHNKSAPHNER